MRLAAVLLAVFACPAWASYTDIAAFTRLTVGARAPALGGACAALDHEATAPVSNPAGLARVDAPICVSMDGSLLPFRQSLGYFGAAGWPLAELALGGGALMYSAGDDIEFRRNNSETPLSVETASSAMYVLAAAVRLLPWLDLGASFKSVSDSIGDTTMKGYSSDLGINFLPLPGISFALVTRDLLSGTMRWSNGYWEKMGVSLCLGTAVEAGPVRVSAEGRNLPEERPRFACGAEWDVNPLFTLRCGLNGTRLAAGFGASGPKQETIQMRADYAILQAVPWDLEHRFSLALSFTGANPTGRPLFNIPERTPAAQPAGTERNR